MTKIRDGVFSRDQFWSNGSGRDYIKVGDEIASINGLYCDEDGTPNRWGKFIVVIDIRWMVLQVSEYDGKLTWWGDAHDVVALDHWGYNWPRRDLFPVGDYQRRPGGDDRGKIEGPRP